MLGDDGYLRFVTPLSCPADRLVEFGFELPDPDAALARAKEKDLPVEGRSVSIAGVKLRLEAA